MAEDNNATSDTVDNPDLLYKPPAPKSVQEILQADQEDESLRKYKLTLLGPNAASIVLEPSNPKNVLVRSLVLLVDGRPDVTMSLGEDLHAIENASAPFIMKEGISYRLRINFHIQREIVAGLKYVQKAYRHGLQVHKEDHMVGSYAPKKDLQCFTTPLEEAPSGMLHRGSYKMKSFFTDDDGNDFLKWDWTLEIKKDWHHVPKAWPVSTVISFGVVNNLQSSLTSCSAVDVVDVARRPPRGGNWTSVHLPPDTNVGRFLFNTLTISQNRQS